MSYSGMWSSLNTIIALCSSFIVFILFALSEKWEWNVIVLILRDKNLSLTNRFLAWHFPRTNTLIGNYIQHR